MSVKYKAAIIGAGKIGAFYSPPNNYQGILTHAHAYKKEKRVELMAFVDINKKKAVRAAKIWAVKAYTNIHEMFKKENPDIVSICTPDETHEPVLKTCLSYKPKIVFCEKPFVANIKSGEYLVKEYTKSGVMLAVNYTRRWNKSMISLKKEIKKGKHGHCLNIIGIYSKGIKHIGSHLIDLLRYFFGEISKAVPLAARIDWKKSDPSLDAFLEFKNNNRAHLIAADVRKFTIFELDLLFEKCRLRLIDEGNKLLLYKIKASRRLKGEKDLKLTVTKRTRLTPTLLEVIPNLINSLEGKERLLCPACDALETQKICQELIRKYLKEERK